MIWLIPLLLGKGNNFYNLLFFRMTFPTTKLFILRANTLILSSHQISQTGQYQPLNLHWLFVPELREGLASIGPRSYVAALILMLRNEVIPPSTKHKNNMAGYSMHSPGQGAYCMNKVNEKDGYKAYVIRKKIKIQLFSILSFHCQYCTNNLYIIHNIGALKKVKN